MANFADLETIRRIVNHVADLTALAPDKEDLNKEVLAFLAMEANSIVAQSLDYNKPPFRLIDKKTAEKEEPVDIDASLQDADVVPNEIDVSNYDSLAQWAPTWFENMRLNANAVNLDMDSGDCNAYNFEVFARKVERPDLVVALGSGPSLTENAKYLSRFPGYIIAGPSSTSIACAHGAPPHGIVAVDSGFGTALYLESLPLDELGCLLITTPSINPEVVKKFKRRLWFNSFIQMGKGAQHPWNIYTQQFFSNISAWMYQAGCTVNAELMFLHMMETWWERRFHRVFLLGTDLAYKPNATRCKAYAYLNNEWIQRDIGSSSTVIHTKARLCKARNGMVTDETMIEYKRSLLVIWQIINMLLYDCSDGIVTEIPKASFKDMVENDSYDDLEEYDERFIHNTFSKYLSETGYIKGRFGGFEGTDLQDDLHEHRGTVV